jgi:hypothetical protein
VEKTREAALALPIAEQITPADKSGAIKAKLFLGLFFCRFKDMFCKKILPPS